MDIFVHIKASAASPFFLRGCRENALGLQPLGRDPGLSPHKTRYVRPLLLGHFAGEYSQHVCNSSDLLFDHGQGWQHIRHTNRSVTVMVGASPHDHSIQKPGDGQSYGQPIPWLPVADRTTTQLLRNWLSIC